jgi:hypothetical protein
MKWTIEHIKKVLRDDPDKTVEGGLDSVTKPPKSNKLHAIKVNQDGYKFDSNLEARRYEILSLWQQAGIIQNLDLEHKKIGGKDLSKILNHRWLIQERFTDERGVKHRAITYTDDFQYEIDGIFIVEDTKGFLTDMARKVHKLLLYRYPHINLFINYKRDGWYFDQFKEHTSVKS